MNEEEEEKKMVEKNDVKISRDDLCNNLVLSPNEYRSAKRMLIAEEKNNFDRIMAIKCSGNGNWFEIADHSALIFYYYVARALKLKVKFTDDFDSFYEQYAIGRIRVRDMESVRRHIEKVEKVRMVHASGGRVTFYLERDFSTMKMEELRKKEIKRRLDFQVAIIAGVWDAERCLRVVEKIIELQKAADKNLAEALSIKGMPKKIAKKKEENGKDEN